MRGIIIIGVSRAEVQEGVPVDDGSTCSFTPQPWYPTLCSLVCYSFYFFFFPLLNTEDWNRQEKSVPHTKYITSPSCQWHTLHSLQCFSVFLCPHSQFTAPRWAQVLSVPLARRAPVCVSYQQLLWAQQSASWLWERGSFFELLNFRPVPGCTLPEFLTVFIALNERSHTCTLVQFI